MDIKNSGNEELDKFLMSLGSLNEIWMFTYRNFISQGLNKDDALEHTQAFMAVFMSAGLGDIEDEE